MNERQRLAFLAKHYNRLKSLRLAPLYLLFTVPPWLSFQRVSVLDALIALGIGIAWFWLLSRYYKEHYGQIADKYELRNTSWLVTWLYAAIAFVGIYFVIIRGSHLPQDFILWFVVAGVVAEGLSYSDSGLRRRYYIVVGVILGIVLMLGSASNMPGHHFFRIYDFTFLGVALLALSIFDHLLLIHSFRPVSPGINA
jgi:hypothetical protein